MFLDLTTLVTPEMAARAQGNEKTALNGHLGTHFDVMNKEFPLENLRRAGLFFNVNGIEERDIDLSDIDLAQVEPDSFVIFSTGYIEREPYGTQDYYSGHPQLSNALIDALLEKGISMIGVDFAGVRRGAEHTPKDQYCADRGVFIVENLCGLDKVLQGKPFARAVVHTYPIRFAGMTGLPCRVVAEV